MKMHSFYCSDVQSLKRWMTIKICSDFLWQPRGMIIDLEQTKAPPAVVSIFLGDELNAVSRRNRDRYSI